MPQTLPPAVAAALRAIVTCRHEGARVIAIATSRPPKTLPAPTLRVCPTCGAQHEKGKWTRAPGVEKLIVALSE